MNPEDFEDQWDYENAIDDIKFEREMQAIEAAFELLQNPNKIRFQITLDVPGLDELDQIKPEDYPNKRKYNAAKALCSTKHGFTAYAEEADRERDMKRYQFILNCADIPSANYLTHDGDILYGKAVSDHFDLPFAVQDEDEKSVESFTQMLKLLFKVDEGLALQVAIWCVGTFMPYAEHITYYERPVAIIAEVLDCAPKVFTDGLLRAFSVNEELLELFMSAEDGADEILVELGSKALMNGDAKIVCLMIEKFLESVYTIEERLVDTVSRIIYACETDDELEIMELFRDEVFPLILLIEKPLVEEAIPELQDRIADYIETVEKTSEKYAYSRRYAWRKTCQNGDEWDIDPLDYETEEEYNQDLEAEKYAWREFYDCDTEETGIDPMDYETEEEYIDAVEGKRYAWREAYKEHAEKSGVDPDDYETEEEFADAVVEVWRQRKLAVMEAERKRMKELQECDPFAETDKTVYTFCGVVFPYGGVPYHYRTDDNTIQVGDKVVVTVGKNEKELVVDVVSVEKHTRQTAPYPVDKIKSIKRKYLKDDR